MIPKIIHLIWFGNDLEVIRASQAHWKEMAPDYEIRLHINDDSLVLPEWRTLYVKANRPSTKSDFLRWSLVLTVGGWYFDCDIRTKIPLPADLDAQGCFITLLGSPLTAPGPDIIATTADWVAKRDMISNVIEMSRGFSEYSLLIEWTLHKMVREHPDWFIIQANTPFLRKNLITAAPRAMIMPIDPASVPPPPKSRSMEEAAALTALPCEVRGKTTAALNGVPLEGICLALRGCDGTYKIPCLARAKSGLPCPLGKFPANCP
jgi:hypothetical protein